MWARRSPPVKQTGCAPPRAGGGAPTDATVVRIEPERSRVQVAVGAVFVHVVGAPVRGLRRSEPRPHHPVRPVVLVSPPAASSSGTSSTTATRSLRPARRRSHVALARGAAPLLGDAPRADSPLRESPGVRRPVETRSPPLRTAPAMPPTARRPAETRLSTAPAACSRPVCSQLDAPVRARSRVAAAGPGRGRRDGGAPAADRPPPAAGRGGASTRGAAGRTASPFLSRSTTRRPSSVSTKPR